MTNCTGTSLAGCTTSASVTPIQACWSWRNGCGAECGCTTGSSGSSPGLADAICWPWALIPRSSVVHPGWLRTHPSFFSQLVRLFLFFHIYSFMERPIVAGSVPKKGHPNPIRTGKFGSISGAACQQSTWASGVLPRPGRERCAADHRPAAAHGACHAPAGQQFHCRHSRRGSSPLPGRRGPARPHPGARLHSPADRRLTTNEDKMPIKWNKKCLAFEHYESAGVFDVNNDGKQERYAMEISV